MKRSTKETIDNYVEKGWEPGGFVGAVLANDLMGAVGRADAENLRDLIEICQYVHWEIPGNCHGSYQIVRHWIKQRRGASSE